MKSPWGSRDEKLSFQSQVKNEIRTGGGRVCNILRVCDESSFQSELKNDIRGRSQVCDKLFFQSEVKNKIRRGVAGLIFSE